MMEHIDTMDTNQSMDTDQSMDTKHFKVKSSQYLSQVKPVLLDLRDRLLEHYPYASILAADSMAKQYSVSKPATSVGMSGWMSGRGFVVKVYDGSSYGEYSFNEITEESIEKIVEKIREELIPLSEGLPESVQRSIYAMLEDEPIVFSGST
mgnify:FL=1